MFKKYVKPSYLVASITFILEIIFLILAVVDNVGIRDLNEIEWLYICLFLTSWALSAAYGGWIQWIGAKHHNAESYIISAGFGMQVPLLQPMTFYFVWKWFHKK